MQQNIDLKNILDWTYDQRAVVGPNAYEAEKDKERAEARQDEFDAKEFAALQALYELYDEYLQSILRGCNRIEKLRSSIYSIERLQRHNNAA